jgi:hypothetical protein
MNTKLTLNLKKNIIDIAKDYAKDHHISLSKLVENYLSSLTINKNSESEISPLVESLTGIIPENNEIEVKNAYYDYLRKKHS